MTNHFTTTFISKVVRDCWFPEGSTFNLQNDGSPFIGETTVGTGGDLGTNNVLVPQLLGRSFQKARNFTASSHQNAGFSIWVFKIFRGLYPRTVTAGGGDPLPHPTPSPAFVRVRGASAPVFGPKPWPPPSTFQPWLRPCRPWYANIIPGHENKGGCIFQHPPVLLHLLGRMEVNPGYSPPSPTVTEAFFSLWIIKLSLVSSDKRQARVFVNILT